MTTQPVCCETSAAKKATYIFEPFGSVPLADAIFSMVVEIAIGHAVQMLLPPIL